MSEIDDFRVVLQKQRELIKEQNEVIDRLGRSLQRSEDDLWKFVNDLSQQLQTVNNLIISRGV